MWRFSGGTQRATSAGAARLQPLPQTFGDITGRGLTRVVQFDADEEAHDGDGRRSAVSCQRSAVSNARLTMSSAACVAWNFTMRPAAEQ